MFFHRNKTHDDKMYNENYIFVTGMHKSGTKLLQRILDGHNNLLSLPFNSSTSEPMLSISDENVNRWKSEITRIEKHIISTYFSPFLIEYGNEVNNIAKRKSRFIPNKKERPLVYILNRLIEYTMLKY